VLVDFPLLDRSIYPLLAREGRQTTNSASLVESSRPSIALDLIMLGDLVNGGGCLAEGSEANNPLAKLSKAVANGPLGGKQPMRHHGQQQQPLMGLHGGPSSMHGMLPSMGPEEESFMQAFHAAPAEEVAAELSRAWASSHVPGHMPGHMLPAGAASSAHDGAWLEAGNLNGAWNEAHASQQAVASHEAARLQPLQQQAGQALHGQLRGMMGNPMMATRPAEVRRRPRALPAPPFPPPLPPSWTAAPHPDCAPHVHVACRHCWRGRVCLPSSRRRRRDVPTWWRRTSTPRERRSCGRPAPPRTARAR
jgi:hypothetical protein